MIDVLHATSNADHVAIHIACRMEDDPMWTPITTPTRNALVNGIPAELVQLNYEIFDKFADTDWLEEILDRNYILFQSMTGYRKRTNCHVCGDCILQVNKVNFVNTKDNKYSWYALVCGNTEPTNVNTKDPPCLCAMGTKDDNTPMRVYCTSIKHPMGTIKHPDRKGGEQHCLAMYVTINRVKAYTLFDSGSMADSVSPDFTWVMMLLIKILEDPVTLQLGCISS